MNKLILGDCLEVLQKLEPESIDLIYIDPPFFSNRTYEVVWGDKGEMRSFEDRWSGGIDQYISWLKDRVQEMHKLLKPTGAMLLHCDWHANAYIRVKVLDAVFGTKNFRNEIIWYYRRWTNVSRQFQNMHDTIFWYSKSSNYTFNKNGYEPSESQKKKFAKGWDQNVIKDSKGNRIVQYIVYNREKFESNCKIREGAKIVYRETDELKVAPPDVLEISILNSQSDERIGYPTQKPEELLHKLIYTASNEGDTVLDCFMGGGTTIAVADKLKRNWIGIDQSVHAVSVTEMRMNMQQGKAIGKTQDMFATPFIKKLYKYDYDTLRYKDAFQFETWIVEQFGGVANTKQRGDLGLDGYIEQLLEVGKVRVPIQSKRSDNIGRNVIDNFKSACERFDKIAYEKNKAENKPVGFIIAFSFGKGAVQEVARLKNDEKIIIKLVTVEEIVPIAKKPSLTIEVIDKGTNEDLREITFVASAESEVGIEFFSWNFNYNGTDFIPEIMLDKIGKQTHFFKSGHHKVAVKVVDGEGLENIEIIELKINGKVERK
jgi:DNA modification methylase